MSESSLSDETKKLKYLLKKRLKLLKVPKNSDELDTYFGMAYDAIITNNDLKEADLLRSEFEEVIEPLFKKHINELKITFTLI